MSFQGKNKSHLLLLIILPTLPLLFGCSETNEELISEALNLQNSKEYKESNRMIDIVLERDSTILDALFFKGLNYDYMGRYEDALNYYYHSLSYDSTLSLIYYNISLIKEKQGKYKEALEVINNAFNSQPAVSLVFTNSLYNEGYINYHVTNQDLLERRAYIYYNLSAYDYAHRDFNDLIESGAASKDYFLMRGMCLIYLGQDFHGCRDLKVALIGNHPDALDLINEYCE